MYVFAHVHAYICIYIHAYTYKSGKAAKVDPEADLYTSIEKALGCEDDATGAYARQLELRSLVSRKQSCIYVCMYVCICIGCEGDATGAYARQLELRSLVSM
jgi:hypothetical protein